MIGWLVAFIVFFHVVGLVRDLLCESYWRSEEPKDTKEERSFL